MPKEPKPFYRDDRRRWYVQFGVKQINLGADEAVARQMYHALMAARASPEALRGRDGPTLLVCEVLDAYLVWCETHRAPRTYAGHLWHLQRFLKSLPDRKTLAAADLKPHHVEAWANAKAGGKFVWGPTYRRNAIGSVKCAFRWAVVQGYLPSSPVESLKKPEAARNRKAVTPAQFERMLALARRQEHRDVLTLLWESGMRPHELRILEARHVDLAGRRLVIPSEEAKGRKHDRRILLTAAALEVVKRNFESHPSGPLMQNTRGGVWTNYGLNCFFKALRKKLDFPASPYLLRHGFATRLLIAREGPATVAALMGHRDPTMVMKVYQHVGDDEDHLREALSRGTGV